jgi:DNA phosphorothioation-associated putative methyltransferase
MTTLVARHRTAMSRTTLSRPLATAVTDQLLTVGASVFDYGCGRGDDVRNLCILGYRANGWDPNYLPEGERQAADVVNLGYVVNVIEEAGERTQVLKSAWALARRLLIVSARLVWDARDLVGRPLGDGFVTRTGTFQKFYEQAELSAWIEQVLGAQPLAAAPGIFYVFRQISHAQEFLARRVHSYRPRARIDPHAVYEAHRELLAPLLGFVSDHARPPRSGELDGEQELSIKRAFGSLGRGLRLIRQVTEGVYWEQIAIQRRSELLIYIALSRFGRRPKFSQLTRTLAGDIKTLFGTYQAACAQADRLLFASGNPAQIYVSARSSAIGKQTPTSLYIHRRALAELPPVLQVYEACARVLSGTVDQANMIKLSVTQPQVSYLSYPSFDREAHPALAGAITVNLRKLSVDWRDYSRSENPPLLHRKEEFVGKDDPRRALYERLTRAEVRAGLYEHPEQIGSLRGWQAILTQNGATIRGHRLTRSN